jgi:hypothetical protein
VWTNEGTVTTASWSRFEAGNIALLDGEFIYLGTANDVSLSWDGTNFEILPVADDTGAMHIGDGTTDFDMKWFGGATTAYVLMDVGNKLLRCEDIDILLGDNDQLRFGDGTNGDLVSYWNATYLQSGPPTGLWANAPSKLDPRYQQTCYEFWDDFFNASDASAAPDFDWIVTEDDAACTQLMQDANGGTLKLTNKATTDDNAQQIVWQQEPFLLAAGKHLWFEARVKCGAGATEVDMAMGLMATEDLTGVADNLPADGVTIHKDDGAVTLKFTASKDGTNTGANADIGDLTTGWHTYGFYVNGVTNITPYFDGTADTAITATICDDEQLAPFFMVRNGDGVTTQTLEIDYIRIVQLR